MVPEATNVCQDDQICARLKEVIDGAVHGVQASWDATSSTENLEFVLVDEKPFLIDQYYWNALDSLPFMAIRSLFCS